MLKRLNGLCKCLNFNTCRNVLSEYLKWIIIVFLLQIVLETIAQAVVMKKKFIICKVDPADDDAKAKGNEWLQTSHRGKVVITVQVIIMIVVIISVI